MICPHCKAEYTSANPCHCSTLEFTPLPAADPKPDHPPDRQPPSLAPTGINNPFWH